MISKRKKIHAKNKSGSGRGRGGFTLVEMMIVGMLIVAATGGIYLIFSAGQASWFTTDADMRIRADLRKALQRISFELRQSRDDKKFVFDGTGVGGSDIIRFSIPIICETDGKLIDTNGDIPYWGGPLNWGCDSLSCMDQDQDCTTLEYKYIEYLLNNDQELRREILDEGLNLVQSVLVAENITDFQITSSGNIITMTVSAEHKADNNRVMSQQASLDVYLRN